MSGTVVQKNPGAGKAAPAHEWLREVASAVHQRVVGQDAAIEGLLIGLLTGGHVLLEGQPGLAKTLMVRSLAQALGLEFRRIQFTPDLLPADILGTPVLDSSSQQFSIRKGPIFANLVLADEINRAPPKVQAALLEAMEEQQVTLAGETLPLGDPFLVLATQNPVESQGTYPLAEAQLDRFALKVRIGYPSRSEEQQILEVAGRGPLAPIEASGSAAHILEARAMVRAVHMDQRIRDYAIDLVCATRSPADFGLAELAGMLDFGASPRATIGLVSAARARACLHGRDYVQPDDVKAIATPVLQHRLRVSYEAELRGVTPAGVLRQMLETVPSP